MGLRGLHQAEPTEAVEPEAPPPYEPVGDFQTDFTGYCEYHGVPTVPVKQLPSSTDGSNQQEKTSGFRDEHRVHVVMSPKVWVDSNGSNKTTTIRTRDWLMTPPCATAFTQAWRACASITSVRLWNVGLDSHAVSVLTDAVFRSNLRLLQYRSL